MVSSPDDLQGCDLAYQAEALNGVSRTFALTIPQLPDGLCDVMGNAYLLCRINDTIEDDPALSIAQKKEFFRRFVEIVAGRGEVKPFARELGAVLSSSTSAEEHDLVANTDRVIRITCRFRPAQRIVLERCVRIMASGMLEIQQEASINGLSSMSRFNSYCYYVAGVVGETLTELFCEHSSAVDARREELLALSRSFGQGLQMTNILKDIWDDRERGTCWLPRDIFLEAGFDLDLLDPATIDPGFVKGLNQLVAISRHHLENMFEYIMIVPPQEAGIRLHCLWTLGLAVLSLRKFHANLSFRSAREVKISRRSVWAVILVTRVLKRSNLALRCLFGLLTRSLPQAEEKYRSIQL